MPTPIGKIVKSNTHIDYVCQVYGPGDTLSLPLPEDYSFGTFVSIRLDERRQEGLVTQGLQPVQSISRLVGVIYNTLLMNPDFGNLGPRLSSRQELEFFSPDFLAETATLVGIITLGWFDDQGVAQQGVPVLAATVNNSVYRLDEDELRAFHSDSAGRLTLRYIPLLLGQNNPLVPPLLMDLVDRLALLFPDSRSQLSVMRNNLAWKRIVQPAG